MNIALSPEPWASSQSTSASWSRARMRNRSTPPPSMPTSAAREGDLTRLASALFDVITLAVIAIGLTLCAARSPHPHAAGGPVAGASALRRFSSRRRGALHDRSAVMAFAKGEKPWNWRGDPIVEPRGYVIVFVGKDHPLADCRGYAYQHRLVAAQVTGELLVGKHVHHDNANHSDNSPSNLKALTHEEHFFYHRKPGSNLRTPGEPNPAVYCECGCGLSFSKFDASRRPRRFVSGHNGKRDRLGRFGG